MSTFQQAKNNMQEYIDFTNQLFKDNYPNKDWSISIIENLTETYEFGWVFYYSDKRNTLVGNGPVIIQKADLHMYQMMTSLDVEENIQLFLQDKNKLSRIEKDSNGIWDTVNLI